jgi:hypothetical protein
LKAEFTRKDEELKQQLELIENSILAHMQELNVSSLKTDDGVAYRVMSTMPTVRDWDSFFSWVRETGNADFLERRVRRSSIEEWLEEHDQPPPGIDVFCKYDVRVRKS